MEVILKEDVKNLGKAGDVVKVSEGYARNFLFPSKKAVPVTEGAVKAALEQQKKKKEKTAAELEAAAKAAKSIAGTTVVVAKRASPDGKLFASVTEVDVAAELAKAGIDVDKNKIKMGKHIKEPGEYKVVVHLKGDAEAEIKVRVEAAK